MIQKVKQTLAHKYEVLDYIITSTEKLVTDVNAKNGITVEADIMLTSPYNFVYNRLFSTSDPTDYSGQNGAFASGVWGLQFENKQLCIKPLGLSGNSISSAFYMMNIYYNDLQNNRYKYNLSCAGILNIYNYDGTLKFSADCSSLTNPNKVSQTYISFFCRDITVPHEFTHCRCYDLKIYDNDVLLRHYIPVKRLSDNIIGFYEIQTETFLTSVTSTDFTGTSKSVPEYIDETTEQTVYVNDIILHGSPTVEHKYELLDYITVPSRSMINTHENVDYNTVVEIVADVAAPAGSARLFSTYAAGYNWNSPETWGLETSNLIWFYPLGYTSCLNAGVSPSDFQGQKLRYNVTASGYLNVYDTSDNLVITQDVSQYSSQTETSENIRLFSFKDTHEYLASGSKIYSVKIWQGNTLTHHYLPVKRLSDNVYGLYDEVDNIFHPNEVSGYDFTGTSKSVPEYIDETVSNLYHINRIYLGGNVYWGNAPETVPHHKIEGTLNSSFSSIYFDRQLTSPGASSFTGGYEVPVYVNDNDWYVDTNDSPQTLVGCFANNNNITSVSIYNLDCTNLNSIESLFDNCQYITSCDVSRLNTSNVTLMGNVFQNCTRLTSIDVSSWDVSKVTRMWGMFREMHAIESIDLSSWNTSSLTLIPHIFYNTQSIQTINMSGWNTTLLQNTDYSFYNCTNLRTLNLSDWDLRSLTSQNSTFDNCSSLADVYITVESTLMKLTNNLTSQGGSYIPSSATIHYNGTDYKWQNNAWTPQSV